MTRDIARQVGIAQAGVGFTVNSLGACLALLSTELGSPPSELAWLTSSFGIGLLAVGLVGRWALRWGAQPALLVSALTISAGTVVLAVSQGVTVAATGSLALGLGAAGVVLVTPALLNGPDAAARLTRVNAAASLAALLGPLAIGATAGTGHHGRLALLIIVPPLLFLATGTRPFSTSPLIDTPHATPPPLHRIAAAWATIVVAVSVEFCFAFWSAVRLQGTGLSAGAAATVATTFLVGMAAGRLAAARLIDRAIPVIPLGCALAAAGTVIVALFNTATPVAVGLVLAGLGIAPFYPVTLARLVRLPGLGPTRSAAYGALASGTAILAAPTALAALGTTVGLRPAYLLAVLPLLLTLAATQRVRNRSTCRT